MRLQIKVMNGWIIYNGALEVKKIKNLVLEMSMEAARKGITLERVANNELIPTVSSCGEMVLKTLTKLKEPEFIIFWDKDIMLARYLEMLGYRLFNCSNAIEACDNKALMHLKLAGMRVPKTIIGPLAFFSQSLTNQYYESVIQELGEDIIIKESVGSFGMQVYKLHGVNELKTKITELQNSHFIIQEVIKSSLGRDIRVNIVGDNIAGAMLRTNTADFRANITLGGKGELVTLNSTQKEIALQAHKELNLDFCGVDLLFGDDGEPVICEVNSNVNFISFQDISGINVSGMILDHIIERIK